MGPIHATTTYTTLTLRQAPVTQQQHKRTHPPHTKLPRTKRLPYTMLRMSQLMAISTRIRHPLRMVMLQKKLRQLLRWM